MITMTPKISRTVNCSPRSSPATATPKNGLRKWKDDARVGPVLSTKVNQSQVAMSPGKIVV